MSGPGVSGSASAGMPRWAGRFGRVRRWYVNGWLDCLEGSLPVEDGAR